MQQPVESVGAILADGDAMERHPQILSHVLHALMVCALHPGQGSITRKEIGPAFESLRYLDAEFKRALHDRRPRVRSKNIGPKFRARIAPANIHHHADRLAPLFFAFSWKAENHVER